MDSGRRAHSLCLLSTAVAIHQDVCVCFWSFLTPGERRCFIAAGRELDFYCLQAVRHAGRSSSSIPQAASLDGASAVMASESDTESLRQEDLAASRWSLADVGCADSAASSCEDVLLDPPLPAEILAAAFGRSFAAEADAAQGFSDRHLALVDDVTSMRHQLSLMAMRLDTQESLIDWLQDRDHEATEEKNRLLTLLCKQAAELDEQRQQLSALSELVSHLRNDFYGQAIARSLARGRSPAVDRAEERRAPQTPP